MKRSYRPIWGMSNLVLSRTLCNSNDAGKIYDPNLVSLLDFVRSKDRRAIEPIVRLTRSKVLDLLADVQFAVHTLAPQI